MKLVLSTTPSQVAGAPFLFCGCPPTEALAVAAELGYDGVELHLRQASDIHPHLVRRQADELGLRISTLGTGLAAGLDGLSFAAPDAAIREQAVERVKGHIAAAAELSAGVIIGSLSGRLGPNPLDRQSRRAGALECLDRVCRYADAAGVVVLLEPLNRYECDYLNTVQDVLAVSTELGASNLRVLADTFHMNIEEVSVTAAIEMAGSKLGHVHLADSNRQAAGHGHLDLASIVRTLHRLDYRGYVSFEVFPLPSPREAAADAILVVRRLLEEQG